MDIAAERKFARTHLTNRQWVRSLTRDALVFVLLALVCIAGCRTAIPFAPVDLAAPGWHVQRGQAVWKPDKNRPELAGDLLFATNENGNYFVQFSKNPFPIAAAQISGGRWQIEFGTGDHAWSGAGPPPNRFAWFQLATAFAGAKIGRGWQFDGAGNNSWRLANPRTGETLEGEFFP